ncbi:hypothetical protein HBI31_106620 [Parastagonospora nodorum]|nr:hypothetical protein HBI31_106620 [Parastagonospora nodorum]
MAIHLTLSNVFMRRHPSACTFTSTREGALVTDAATRNTLTCTMSLYREKPYAPSAMSFTYTTITRDFIERGFVPSTTTYPYTETPF